LGSTPASRPGTAVPGTRARPLRAATALALAAGLAGGCAVRPGEPLRIGINAEPGYEFAYLAQERGLFAHAGVRVQLVEFSCMSDSRRAYERGQLDGFFGTVVEVVQAKGGSPRTPRIVRVLDRSRGFDVVLAGPGIRNVQGLRGRRVAVEAGSLNIYLLSRALQRQGLGLDDVTLVDSDPAEMPAAIGRGAVDAAVCYPPVSSAIVAAGTARPVFSSAEIPDEVVDILAVDSLTLARRERDVRAFLRAYDEAVAWMSAHPDEACGIMAEREGVTPREFRESLEVGLELVSASRQSEYFGPGGILPRVVEQASLVLVQTGQLTGPVPAAAVLPPGDRP
jgi:NitT/TauT family transport system substrate-binding protein